ncbi:MAG TPA: peptidyl-prolyl cis-trans isomerase [Azospira sp.]|nr:peptidyl-prolyl cis-trans isomerase [Azospira sp.]
MSSGFAPRLLQALFIGAGLASAAVAQTAPTQPQSPAQPPAQAQMAVAQDALFATVNGKPVTLREYDATFSAYMREKYYHRQVPEGEMAMARDEVRKKIVQRVLLTEEAERRNIQPDAKAIAEQLANYDARYASSPAWVQNRERMLPGLKTQLEAQSRLEILERDVRGTPTFTEDEVRAYYDAHLELFTEPEKLRLSAILLGVDPSAGAPAWQKAREEAKTLHAQLVAGGDFAEAARLRSSGKLADAGGDAGYLHRGMLPEAMQQRIDDFVVGAIAEPMDVLEGVVIVRLDERVAPKRRDFADVAARARDLAVREKQEQAWSKFLQELTDKADVKIVFNHTGGEGK